MSKTYQAAEKAAIDRDEERAYVLFIAHTRIEASSWPSSWTLQQVDTTSKSSGSSDARDKKRGHATSAAGELTRPCALQIVENRLNASPNVSGVRPSSPASSAPAVYATTTSPVVNSKSNGKARIAAAAALPRRRRRRPSRKENLKKSSGAQKAAAAAAGGGAAAKEAAERAAALTKRRPSEFFYCGRLLLQLLLLHRNCASVTSGEVAKRRPRCGSGGAPASGGSVGSMAGACAGWIAGDGEARPATDLPRWHRWHTENGRYFYLTRAGTCKMYWDLPDDVAGFAGETAAQACDSCAGLPTCLPPLRTEPEKFRDSSTHPDRAANTDSCGVPKLPPPRPSLRVPPPRLPAPASQPAALKAGGLAGQNLALKQRSKPESDFKASAISAALCGLRHPGHRHQHRPQFPVLLRNPPLLNRRRRRFPLSRSQWRRQLVAAVSLARSARSTRTHAQFTEWRRNTAAFWAGTLPFTEQFSVVVQALWAGRYACVSPVRLQAHHRPARRGLRPATSSRTPQEFLLFLLDGLHEDLNRRVGGGLPPELEDKESLPDVERAKRAWARHCLINESIMVELFQGQFKSTLVCEQCHYKSITFDAFMYLSLPVVSDTSCRLSDCLQAFLKPERLSGSSRWFCPRCRRDQSAVKKIDIWRLPPYLLIHFKRFSCDRLSSRGRKLNTLLRGQAKHSLVYNLYGVSNHFGSMECGHYTAFCVATRILNRWFKFDDETVTEMRSGEIRSVSNYILFYSRLANTFQVSSS
uniref:ubiquitinyl hydrolase 1 n=1 Tax=Macrostomum lignano TaxID=282301 RepID=A0A1I8JRE0_9PLAT